MKTAFNKIEDGLYKIDSYIATEIGENVTESIMAKLLPHPDTDEALHYLIGNAIQKTIIKKNRIIDHTEIHYLRRPEILAIRAESLGTNGFLNIEDFFIKIQESLFEINSFKDRYLEDKKTLEAIAQQWNLPDFPWRILPPSAGIDLNFHVSNEEDNFVAHVYGFNHSNDQRALNAARLIAAAPDLLLCCMRLRLALIHKESIPRNAVDEALMHCQITIEKARYQDEFLEQHIKTA